MLKEKRQQEILEERKIIHSALEERVSSSPNKKKGKKPSKATQLESEIAQLSKETEEIRKDINRFLQKVYPQNEVLEGSKEHIQV